jgi:phosphoribosyl-AMP cyclohydrolase / phosphoribosyl-ATP pyrophosphohydrolase
MNAADVRTIDWDKSDGLVPAVVQHAATGRVLMVGYMNHEALQRTLEERRVTFFSRSRQQLWSKGETSGNVLDVVSVTPDCDNDALLVLAEPRGPTCHLGPTSCFGDGAASRPLAEGTAFLATLEAVVAQRIAERPEGSYTAKLWAAGPTRMAQKVGEEGVETALAAATGNDEGLIGEAADLLYHLTLLLKSRGMTLTRVVEELARRHASRG